MTPQNQMQVFIKDLNNIKMMIESAHKLNLKKEEAGRRAAFHADTANNNIKELSIQVNAILKFSGEIVARLQERQQEINK